MSDKALLAEILKNPGDDGPRLAYAKWLKANGDPDRAEFIKVQCDRAAKASFDPAQEKLAKRERSLLNKHEGTWKEELPEWARIGVYFHRGFPSILGCYLDVLVGKLALLVKTNPIEGVMLSVGGASPDTVEALAECPEVARFTELKLWHNDVGTKGAKAIARSSWFAGLKTLHLGAVGLKDPAVKALAASAHLAGLTELNLSSNSFGTAGLGAILAGPWKLQTLTIHGAPLHGIGMATLAAAASLSTVSTLEISSGEVGPDDAATLAGCSYLGNLKVLDIAHNPLTAEGVRAIVMAPWATNLVALHMQNSDLDDEAGRIFLTANLPNLRRLTLVNNRFSNDMSQALWDRYG
jgi:uncharacterized protein (TIGR02996 family)